MPEPNSSCDTCAFRQGCETHDQEVHNRLRSEVAALGGIPFFCHHGFDWQSAEVYMWKGRFVAVRGQAIPHHVCEGWKARVRELNAAGHFAAGVRPFLRAAAGVALRSINEFIDSKDDKVKKQKLQQIENMLHILTSKGAA